MGVIYGRGAHAQSRFIPRLGDRRCGAALQLSPGKMCPVRRRRRVYALRTIYASHHRCLAPREAARAHAHAQPRAHAFFVENHHNIFTHIRRRRCRRRRQTARGPVCAVHTPPHTQCYILVYFILCTTTACVRYTRRRRAANPTFFYPNYLFLSLISVVKLLLTQTRLLVLSADVSFFLNFNKIPVK